MSGAHTRFRARTCRPLLLSFLALLAAAAWWQLARGPFHEDEAIYAAWGLAIGRGDPFLWHTAVDKPPLSLYPISATVALLGRHEWAARLPNLFWSGAWLALLGRLAARRGAGQGAIAVGLALLSPLSWALAASAFTDPAMLALALLATERARDGRPAQAGLAFALALLAKPTALFLLPLVVWGMAGARGLPGGAGTFPASALAPFLYRFTLAGAAPLLLAWAWDASREAPSWWVLGAQAYGTLGSPALQAGAWLTILGMLLGPLLLPLLLSARRAPGPLLLAVGWIALHAAFGFQPWARYGLPLVALLALGLAPVVAAPALRARLWPAWGLLLLVPLLVQPLRLEPHDDGWRGMAAMGAAIEALPIGSTLWYEDAGRPLQWYAADARAALRWAGVGWHDLPAALLPSSPTYLLARREEVPSVAAGWPVAARAGHFVLLEVP